MKKKTFFCLFVIYFRFSFVSVPTASICFCRFKKSFYSDVFLPLFNLLFLFLSVWALNQPPVVGEFQTGSNCSAGCWASQMTDGHMAAAFSPAPAGFKLDSQSPGVLQKCSVMVCLLTSARQIHINKYVAHLREQSVICKEIRFRMSHNQSWLVIKLWK